MSSLRQDLGFICTIPEDLLERSVQVLCEDGIDNIDWFIYVESLDESDRESISALYRAVTTLSTSFAEARSFSDAMKELEEAMARLTKNDDAANSGWNKLKGLFSSPSSSMSSFLVAKKEEVVKSRFSRVANFSITIDARPIFSMDRKTVEKVIYPHIVKIVTQDDKEFLGEFYEDQLDRLMEELSLAKQKLSILKNNFKS